MNSGRRGGATNKNTATTARPQQPPRILVVDIQPPHWAHTCHQLCDALENVFSLACSLAGPPRMPLFSLYVAQNQQECLLPFVPVRGGFSRLQSCIAELRAFPVEGVFRPNQDMVSQAVQDGLQQFKQYTRQGMAGASLCSSSVEITVLTSQLSTEVAKWLEAGLQGADLACLQQLQVVELSSRGVQEPSESEWAPPAGQGPGSTESSAILGTGIDLQTVEGDTVALEMFFKAWLHDHDASQEHVHLLLPSGALGQSAAPWASQVCVKCDVQERLLSPTLLPADCGGTASVDNATGPFWGASSQGQTPPKLRVLRQNTSSKTRPVIPSSPVDMLSPSGTAATTPPPPCKLCRSPPAHHTAGDKEPSKAHGSCHYRALKAEGLCESVLFGLPLVIKPTSCWQMNWDELEANQQSFQALCHCLGKREWLLLARYEPQGETSGPRATSYQVLLPSGSSLLLRSVVSRELLLPCTFPLLPANAPDTALSMMESILDGLKVDPAYNPLSVTTHLYRALSSRLGRPPASRPQRLAERSLPRQQTSWPHLSKARATVAPLHMVLPTAGLASSLFSSEEEEFLTSM